MDVESTMAASTSLLSSLSSLTDSLTSATQALASISSILPPDSGISLLDTKNDLFLSYLQALALRNLNVIRSLKEGCNFEDAQRLSDNITGKLIEHRVYLERGVRPLEAKIKYQTDKVIKAADDEDRAAQQKQKIVQSHVKSQGSESEESNSNDDGEDDEEVEQTSYRPNLAGFGTSNGDQNRQPKPNESAVYRPPRISATTMPTTEPRERKAARPSRSATLEEYVQNELSTAPLAQPSIGSTISGMGRRTKDTRQLAKEAERRDYEETHLVRLPAESKKELAKQKLREQKGGWGGEEWRGLGETADKIGEMTGRRGKGGVLEKSRKRGRAVEDGPRGDGMGGAFDLKKRRVMKKMRM